MNSRADNLIATLTEDLASVTPAAHPVKMFAIWLAISTIYVAVLLCFSHLRPDLIVKLQENGFLAEIGLLALMAITSGLSATVLSFPDLHQKNGLLWMPLVPLLLFTALMIVGYNGDTAPLPLHGIECTLCICLYSLIPAVAMMLALRKQASTHPAFAGAVSLIAASSLGCLALRLSEDTDSIKHLVTWHYLPMAAFALLGVIIGRKILKW